ncbi:MAG: hypothetical protein CL693_21030 [Cellvibrionaceae bacterium]|nr:hypothetical protein [Cellvibrionaceae bacterium]
MSRNSDTTSVVIPCFNGARVLPATIETLLNQELLPDEIIVVDDGSDDDTVDVATQFGARVRVLTQENQGAASARHTGALNAKNDIVFFVDAGDTSPPGKIRALRDALVANPDCICAYGECWNKDKDKPQETRFTHSPLDGRWTTIADPFEVLLGQSWPLASAMNLAVRRDYAIKGTAIGSFYRAGNDYAMQLNLARFGAFVHVASITSEFKIFGEGLTSQHGIDQQMSYSLLAAVEFYLAHSSRDHYRKVFRKRISYYWPTIVYFMWNNSNVRLRNQVIKAGLRYGSVYDSMKSFIWTLVKEHKRGREIRNPVLGYLARQAYQLSQARD